MHKQNYLHTCQRLKIVAMQWWPKPQIWNSYYCTGLQRTCNCWALHLLFHISFSILLYFSVLSFLPFPSLVFFFSLVTGPLFCSFVFLTFPYMSLVLYHSQVPQYFCLGVPGYSELKSNLCSISVSCCTDYCILQANNKSTGGRRDTFHGN